MIPMQLQDGPRQVDDTRQEQVGDRVDVVAEPGHDPSGRVLLVERDRQLLEVVVHARAQVEQDALADETDVGEEPAQRRRPRSTCTTTKTATIGTAC